MKLITQHKWQRAVVSFSILAVAFCASLCTVEALAQSQAAYSNHKSDHQCSRHAGSGPQNEKNGQKATCCSNLLAADSVLKNIVSFDLVKNLLYPQVFSFDQQQQVLFTEYYLLDLSPGESPPTAFLSSHTSHAPPLS